jgi:cytochrome c biogenesis protein CcdA/peroxiredoxin
MSNEQIEPKKNRKWLKITGITLVSLIVLAGIGYGSYYIIDRRRNITPAPDFSLITIANDNFTLSDYLGQVILLDFMSYSCQPCRDMMPDLVEFAEEYNDSIIILSIDVDLTDSIDDLKEFKNEYNATWPFALDTADLLTKYGATPLPKTVIIDKEGFVTFADTGFIEIEDIRSEIDKALAGIADRENIGYRFIMVAAFFSGILSFFSPCAFPLLPGYMAYNLDLLMRDERKEEEKEEEKNKQQDSKIDVRRRVRKSFLWGSAAAFGVLLFYMIIGLISAFVGEVVSEWVEYMTPAIGAILIILGIISFTPLKLDMGKAVDAISKIGSRRRKKANDIESEDDLGEDDSKKKRKKGRGELPQMFQLFIYGITYSLASLGCNLPILLGLVVGSIEAGAFGKALLIFLVYSVSMAVLMILITMLVGFSKDVLINKLQASTKFIKIFSGILLILAGGFLIGWFLWGWYKPK